ncbi:MAG TPA: DNA translocase FtsK 4TM domain-containing protein [Kofleriaceae bacterium]|nr:DNA translocase FtsK 4TM domain-containing protein [Kofleriaceae bacterium]
MSKNRRIRDTSVSPRAGGSTGRRREVVGVVSLGASIFLLIALVSLQAGQMVMGPFGRWVASQFYGVAGVCGYFLIALAVVAAIRTLIEREPVMPIAVVIGGVVGAVSLAILAHLTAGGYRVAGHGPGGALGEHVGEILRAVISTAGTALLALVGLVVAAVVATPLRTRDVLQAIGGAGRTVGGAIGAALLAVARFWRDVFRAMLPDRERDIDDDDDDEDIEVDERDVLEVADDEAAGEPVIIGRAVRKKKKALLEAVGTAEPTQPVPAAIDGAAGGPTDRVATQIEVVAAPLPEAPAPAPARGKRTRFASGTQGPPVGDDAPATLEAAPPLDPQERTGAPVGPPPPPGASSGLLGPVIVESRFKNADKATMAAKEKAAEAERQTFIKIGEGDYQLPSIQLLNYDASTANQIDKTAMLELSAKLTQTLENYGVKGDVVAIRPGPVVTMYEFAPAPGTRVNKIVNLTDDLALALEALRVRIVAPIPGKAAVGIEVPNKTREKVFIKEILADDAFLKGRSKLPLALGKDIEGGPAVVDLARMPHLLVAGTTGSGKSVAVNAMISSLLYHCSPEDVRMIMVDPKMLELSIYEGVPHLLLPVVTDPKKANLALRWAVEEMDRRYDLLAQMGVRDIGTYNDKVGKQLAKLEAEKLRAAADAAARAVEDDIGKAVSAETPEEADARERIVTAPPHRLPYIVVVIDEFADLMMCAPKEVETSVARIAQKARASGIHLILATQRPSVDVITGLIKANFPSRIAFSVASKIDSRTILDQTGAEALLGAGDMLFSDRGAAPQRLHGCYVDEDEIQRVVAFLKTQGRPVYNLDILKPREEEEDGGAMQLPAGKSDDDMYDKAVYIVTTTRNASISWVQRQLRIGYNRAARLVEEMEKQGVVSPPDHTNKREVLVAQA